MIIDRGFFPAGHGDKVAGFSSLGCAMDEVDAIHRGGCHCGRVRFELRAPARLTAWDCNCSICRMSGFLHLILPRSRFTLLAGADELSSYRFNSGIADHLFCRVCGVKSFYVPRSNPDGYSVNARCLDPGTVVELSVQPFDGDNWERHAAGLADLSKEAG